MEQTIAIRDVLAERKRQIEEEGWTAEHDDTHRGSELADAAMAYVMAEGPDSPLMVDVWPWHWKWWKPKTRRRNLVRAAALIIAEIERLDRIREAVLAEGR